MKQFWYVVAIAVATVTQAQVVITVNESADKSAKEAGITIVTPTRQFTPLIITTKKDQPNASTSTRDTVIKTRLGDGTYFESQHRSTVTRALSPTESETTTEIVDKDRQGGERERLRRVETVAKSGNGEQLKAVEYRLTSSGELTKAGETTAVTAKASENTTTTVRKEMSADLSGRLVPKEEVEETSVKVNDMESRVTSTRKSFNHVESRFEEAGRESRITRVEGNTTQTETEVSKPTRSGWSVVETMTVTESRQPDGTIQRETVEQGRSLYSKSSGDDLVPLVPKLKIVEHQARQTDGTTVILRDVYRRDVNGDWKAESFNVAADPEREAAK